MHVMYPMDFSSFVEWVHGVDVFLKQCECFQWIFRSRERVYLQLKHLFLGSFDSHPLISYSGSDGVGIRLVSPQFVSFTINSTLFHLLLDPDGSYLNRHAKPGSAQAIQNKEDKPGMHTAPL